jgi:two-component system, OmpR family, phosphate regulon response regulator PhoB
MNAKVLIVEDEEALALLLQYNLEAEGFRVSLAQRGDEAEVAISEDPPDLIILDWMLPGLSGIELCRRLRARKTARPIPILILTARGEEQDRIRGLTVGADDYVVKPFSVLELLARVRAILRRASPSRIAQTLEVDGIQLDREAYRVVRNGRQVRLGPTEFRLLEFLMETPGRVFTRTQLLDGVWGRDVYVDERTVDVHIGRLRKAINRGKEKDPIRTVRGAGYALGEKFRFEACLGEEVELGHTPWLPAPAVYSIAALNSPALARHRIIGDRRMVLAVRNAKRLAPPAEMKPFLHGIADRPMAHAFLEVDQLDLPIGRWFEFRNRAKRNDRRGRCLAFKRLRRHFKGGITEGAILHLG